MANRIKELRKSKNLTLKQLSAKTGISVSSLSAYEKMRMKRAIALPKLISGYNSPIFLMFRFLIFKGFQIKKKK